ncbi:hypothetical protein AVEN_7866-1 [Araneus ventricosus]|uniref:Uncharacterized protein n=1 Tax=Araneus ventricosus TaxID=182803 RepID=A0A4Y2MGF6_ARAVE|nr:hypothetical protein AVEN_7866-1 [Araneus ventricosus]
MSKSGAKAGAADLLKVLLETDLRSSMLKRKPLSLMQPKYQTQVEKSGAKDGAAALSSLDKQEETTFFNAAKIPDTSCKIWSQKWSRRLVVT